MAAGLPPSPARRPAPPDIDALLALARALEGVTLGELAQALGVAAPRRLGERKGWAGGLIEIALGADAGHDAEPDFLTLGVELKTIPLRADGRAAASTWVTHVPLDAARAALPLERSSLWRKLSTLLWVPISDLELELVQRRVGRAHLWRPAAAEVDMIARDYDDLMALVLDGRTDEITAHLGDALQIRPKGRSGRDRVAALDADFGRGSTGTRGFYLRAAFTTAVLRRLRAVETGATPVAGGCGG